MASVLGILAAVLGVIGTWPYVRDTVRGVTVPHRGTWLIWTALAVVAFVAQRDGGAGWSAVMCGAQALTNGTVLVLAVHRGTGAVAVGDRLLLVLAAAGVTGWVVAGDPLIALGCVVAADVIAAALMLPKSWADPGSETMSTFVLASISGVLAAGAASSPSLLVYPVYYCLVNAGLASVLWVAIRRAASTGGAVRAAPGSPGRPGAGGPVRGRAASRHPPAPA